MVARKSVLVFLNTIVAGVLGFVVTKLTAVYFGVQAYGQVGYALGVVGLLYAVADFGFPAAHQKRLSEGAHEGDCIATYATIKLVLTTLLVVLVLALVFVRVVLLGSGFFSTSILTLLAITGYYAFKSVYGIAYETFNGKRATADAQLVLLAENAFKTVATLVAVVLVAAAVGKRAPLTSLVKESGIPLTWIAAHGPEILALTWLAGSLFAAVVGLAVLRRHYRFGRWDAALFRSYAAFATPMILYSVVALFSSHVDRITIGYFWGASEVGAYFGAQRVTTLLEAIPTAVVLLLFPTFSTLSASRDHEAAHLLLSKSLRYILVFTLPLTLFLVVFGESVLNVVLTGEWSGTGPTLALLASSIFFYSLSRPYHALLSGMNKPGEVARLGIITVVLNALLTLVLVPADIQALGIRLFGLRETGAALGLALATFAGLVLSRQAARRHLGGGRTGVRLWAHALAGGAMALAFWALHEHSGLTERFYVLAAFGLAGFGVYLAGLLALGDLTREDLRYFWSLANPRRFLREAFERPARPGG